MLKLVRSMLVGGVATLVDQAALFALIVLLGVTPRAASIPALLLAGTVQFAGQRRIVFRSNGNTLRQAALFACVHAMTLLLNAMLFEAAMRLAAPAPYWAIRLVIGNAVYLAWSYPMLKRVFRVTPERAAACARPSRP